MLNPHTRIYSLLFFFFQAEDGIRDTSVTGVQTCALPIFGEHIGHRHERRERGGKRDRPGARAAAAMRRRECRSEERRVGEECRRRREEEERKKRIRRGEVRRE